VAYRGENVDGKYRGYELRFEPLLGRVGLYRCAGDAEDTVAPLAEIPDTGLTGAWRQVKIEQQGPRHRVWLDGATTPAIDVEDSQPLAAPGRFGLRTWGSPLSVKDASATTNGVRTVLDQSTEAAATSPERRSLEAFCLLMLNLNEFVYID
jgi:hypothetical protein